MVESPPDRSAETSPLRQRAEALLRGHVADLGSPSPSEIQRLVYELEVHRIELEMQKDELRRAQQDLETTRDRYVELYDFAPVGYITLDVHGAIREINLTGAGMLGIERSRLIRHPLVGYVARGDKRTFLKHVRRCVQDGEEVGDRMQLVAKGDRKVSVELRSVPVQQAGAVLCRTAIVDVTARVSAEQAKQDAQARFQAVVKSIPDALMIIDAKTTRFVDVNEAAMQLYGYTRTEFLKLKHAAITAEPEKSTASFQRTLAGITTRIPFRYHKKKDGTVFPVEISAGTFIYGDRRLLCGAIRDITERLRQEVAIVTAKDEWERTFDAVPDLIAILDRQHRIVRVNRSMAVRLGLTTEQCAGQQCHQLMHGTSEPPSFCPLTQLLRDGQQHTVEVLAASLDADFEITVAPLLDVEGQVTGCVHVARDITERKLAERALQESELRYRTMFEDNTAIKLLIDPSDGSIVEANSAACDFYGYSRQRLLQLKIQQINVLGEREVLQLNAKASTRECVHFELRHRLASGEVKDVEVHTGPIKVMGRTLLFSIIHDITERKHLEKELGKLTIRERRRFGQDLHDGLGQELTGLGYLSGLLHDELRSEGHPQAEMADRLTAGIRDAIAAVRTLAKGLVPVEVDAGGLMAALGQLATRTEMRTGIPCRFQCDREVAVEDNTVATELFRIAQEGINNATKHAQTRRMGLELSREMDGSISLRVWDDGVGLPNDLTQTEGVGLRIIQHRADRIGAKLHVQTAEGGGTELLCVVCSPTVRESC